MRLQLIACKVLQREAYLCAARSPNIVDIVFLEQGLHNTPDKLRERVRHALTRTQDIQGNRFDASLLGYGLCSNGIVGLSAEIPIVVPRAHDCITLLLGSKEKYKKYFDAHPGTYWYSPGWIEFGDTPGPERHEKKLREYEEKYGADNAQYLMEAERAWLEDYRRTTYIDWQMPHTDHYKDHTRKAAEFLELEYDEFPGASDLFQRFLDGKWNEEDFLVVPPGKKIADDVNSDRIVEAD